MQNTLKPLLEIQELDMQMIRLLRLKRQREKELQEIENLRNELRLQEAEKREEVERLSQEISEKEKKIEELKKKLKELESKQASVKKVDEFNALTKEMTLAERERIAIEQEVSNLVDKKTAEEEIQGKIAASLKESEENSRELENEIRVNIQKINEEGQSLKAKRDTIVKTADTAIFAIYERLLRNKKDRVVVPIENRTCSGCHIALTAQHENLVRKGSGLVFCEHCSRIHYWQEDTETGEEAGLKRRRRRRTTSAAPSEA